MNTHYMDYTGNIAAHGNIQAIYKNLNSFGLGYRHKVLNNNMEVIL